MAREYARYLASNHRADDWHEMTTTQHDCYMAILSSPDLSWAGVVPYIPARFAIASDLNERKVSRAWDELEALNKLIVDKGTGEVCVRTFLRHDNVFAKPNITKAFCLAFERVRSEVIRRAIVEEVRKLYADNRDEWGASWEAIEKRSPELFLELFPEPSDQPIGR